MSKGTTNKVFLIGNVGNTPDVRYTRNGNPVVSLSLATDESYRDKATGQTIEETEWHSVVIFGKLAEVAAQYVKTGHKLHVMGKNRTRRWQKDGQDRRKTEVVVDNDGQMEMLSPAAGGSQHANAGQRPQHGHPDQGQPGGSYYPEPAPAGGGMDDWDDIPN